MKIVIVGGGTSGWLAALKYADILKNTKDLDVTVIDSSKIPISGTGEGSTGIFVDFVLKKLINIKIDELDFLYKTQSTLKLGIRMKDWDGIGTEYYSPISPSQTHNQLIDIDFLINHYKSDYFNASEAGYMMHNDLTTFHTNKKTIIDSHSWHFDAHKVGQYFKEISLKNGIKTIDDEIVGLNTNPSNGMLNSVTLTSGIKLEADFWIDCSGFAKVLINPMGGGWVSYEKDLPTNTALPFLQKYETNDNIRMETLAWAQPNGWMWKIPTQERYGCGYVYCDSFTSEDGAIAELEKTIGKSVEPIRKIKFDVGRLDKFWVKNVVAIGLSSGFLEPLQATSIHCTTMQIHILMNLTLSFTTDMNDIIYDTNIRRYNNIIGKLFDEFKDLLQLHYMTKRNDSEFWKYCKDSLERTDKVKEILEICKHKSPSMIDFKMSHGAAGWAVWGWTLVGLGHISKETAKKTLEANSMMEYALKRFDEINHYNRLNSVRMMKNDAFMKSLLKKEFIKK